MHYSCALYLSACLFVSTLPLSAGRYMEALTPLLSNLHPSYLVDQLHDKVSSDVQDQNKIKKSQAKQVRV